MFFSPTKSLLLAKVSSPSYLVSYVSSTYIVSVIFVHAKRFRNDNCSEIIVAYGVVYLKNWKYQLLSRKYQWWCLLMSDFLSTSYISELHP